MNKQIKEDGGKTSSSPLTGKKTTSLTEWISFAMTIVVLCTVIYYGTHGIKMETTITTYCLDTKTTNINQSIYNITLKDKAQLVSSDYQIINEPLFS